MDDSDLAVMFGISSSSVASTSETPGQTRLPPVQAITSSLTHLSDNDPPGSRRIFDVSTHLNPELYSRAPSVDHTELERYNLSTRNDPGEYAVFQQLTIVSINMLSAAEAESLLAHFHQHLSRLIGILDPNLHTVQYLSNTSSVLASGIMAVSARFVRPDIYSHLFSHFQTLLNRAIQDDVCDTSLVQSLLVAVYWKEVTDLSVWRKIGIALRMAYQMRWHVMRKGPLPQDERRARIVVVRL